VGDFACADEQFNKLFSIGKPTRSDCLHKSNQARLAGVGISTEKNKMKRQLTAEQVAKRDTRRAQFKALWKQVAAMPELERIQMSNKLGLVTCDGHALSLCNTMLVALQHPGATVLGGFRQWLKHGRVVIKGQHGAMIWCPTCKHCDGTQQPDGTDPVAAGNGDDLRFIIGTVFDISQTQEIEVDHPVAIVSPEIADAFGMANLPNVRVEDSTDCMGSEENVETHFNEPREEREFVAA
jgi:hypothetical protein